MNPFNVLTTWHTYIAAIGLFGLGIYQLSEGQFSAATSSIMAGLAALGITNTISRHEASLAEFKKTQLKHKK